MKKIYVVLLFFVILLSGYSIIAFQTSFDVEPDFDLGLDTPDNLVRTIYNPIFDDTVTFVKFSKETNGAFTLLEIDLAPGGGNGTHFHERFSETFIALSGELGVEHSGKEISLLAGESKTVVAGETHRFYNPGSERIKFQVKIEPGSAGFEKALYLMYGLTQDGYAKENGLLKELGHTALFVKLSNTRVPGALNLLNPLLKSRAQKMEETGEAQELLQRYYYSKVE